MNHHQASPTTKQRNTKAPLLRSEIKEGEQGKQKKSKQSKFVENLRTLNAKILDVAAVAKAVNWWAYKCERRVGEKAL